MEEVDDVKLSSAHDIEPAHSCSADDWSCYYDETYRRYYYVNNISGESQWENPYVIDATMDQQIASLEMKDTEQVDGYKNITTHEQRTTAEGDEITNDPLLSSSSAHREIQRIEYEEDVAESIPSVDEPADATGKLVDDDEYEAYEALTLQNYRNRRRVIEHHRQQEKETTESDSTSLVSSSSFHRLNYPMARRNEDGAIDDWTDSNVNHTMPTEYMPLQQSKKNSSKYRKGKKNTKTFPETSSSAVGGMNYDYLGMAVQYRVTRKYQDPDASLKCLLCRKQPAIDVFFPCEHRCVCRRCIQTEHICTESQLLSGEIPDGYCNCSLCAGIIKLILPAEGGAEVEKYWRWVYEEPIFLPPNFLRNFRHSAAVIHSVFGNSSGAGGYPRSLEEASNKCAIS